MSITVRPVKLEDKPQWIDLWHQYLSLYKPIDDLTKETTEVLFDKLLDSTKPVYSAVAELDGMLIGIVNYITHIFTWTIEDALYINDLYVAEASRSLGAGQKLMQFVFQHADQLNCKKCYWSTNTDNTEGHALYAKVGFQPGKVVYQRFFRLGNNRTVYMTVYMTVY